MVENMEGETGVVLDLEAMEAKAQRTSSQNVKKHLRNNSQMRKRKRKLVDPLQFEMSIMRKIFQAMSLILAGDGPAFRVTSPLKNTESLPMSGKRRKANMCDRLHKRQSERTPRHRKRIRFLEVRLRVLRNVGLRR